MDQKDVTVDVHCSKTITTKQTLIILFLSGLWLIVSASEPDGGYKWEWTGAAFSINKDSFSQYAIAVGAGGVVFSSLTALLLRFKPEQYDRRVLTVKSHEVTRPAARRPLPPAAAGRLPRPPNRAP